MKKLISFLVLPLKSKLFRSLIILINFYLAGIISAKAQVANVQDSLQLINLYDSTGGANWTNRTGWLTTTPVRLWYGINLNSGGRVISINLALNNLTGRIQDLNLSLPFLKTLFLSSNNLTGIIPMFTGLPNLENLDLSVNSLSGSIPPLNLPQLKILYTGRNPTSGTIPDFNLPSLVDISLYGNHLTGPIPNFNFPNLQYLNLNANQLSDTVPNFNFPQLKRLDISENQLSGTVPNFSFPHVIEFNIWNNQMTGSLPNFNFPELRTALLHYNQLSGSIPNFNFPVLQSISFDHNQFSGLVPNFSFPDSAFVNISYNNLTFDGLEYIEQQYTNAVYSPQANITIGTLNDTLYVSAGGTLSNNTYKWYLNNVLDTTIVGDSTLKPQATGIYRVEVINAVATELTLKSNVYSVIPSIFITGTSQIPPWQRLGEPEGISGLIVVNTTPSLSPWHLEIYKNDILLYSYPSSTNFQKVFSSLDATIPSAPWGSSLTDGDIISYKAVLDINGATSESSLNTTVTERKWTHKNYVYYNSPERNILIPLKYFPNTTSIDYSFSREEHTSAESDNISDGGFPANTYQFIKLDYNDLHFINPGVFNYTITYNGANISETGQIDLTKIGKLGDFGNTSQDTLIVFIGGNRNNIEDNFQSLNGVQSKDFSIAENFRFGPVSSIKATYNTWYIGQSNTNYLDNNAYDIALALDSIKTILNRNNTNPLETHLIAHSFGGLQVRAMLTKMGKKNDGTPGVTSQSLLDSITSVTFLSSPHRGIYIGSWQLIDGNAHEQAENGSSFLNSLDEKQYPAHIRFLNVTGIDKTPNPIFPGIYTTDGVVDRISSERPQLTNDLNQPISVGQLYVGKSACGCIVNTILSDAHSMTHHSDIVSNSSYNFPGNIFNDISTLNKMFNFIRGISQNYPLITSSDVIVNSSGSVLPGSKFSIKYLGDTGYYLKGITDENGSSGITFFPSLQIGDSIKIEVTGYETLFLAVDSEILSSGKINASMLKSSISTNNIKYPTLKLINQNAITASGVISLEAKGQNALSYKINSPFNQDSIFVPLSLTNNLFTAQLDSFYNLILVRYIGSQDSITLAKEVYYFPDSLMEQSTYNVSITTPINGIGTKVYVNNYFVKQINSLNDTIPVLNRRNILKFSKFGYVDSVLTVDSSVMINLSLQLFSHSYSSLTDSSIVDFLAKGKIQFRKNVTMMDSVRQTIISLKQYDDYFPGKGFVPKSRKFEIRHLNSNWSGIKLAAVLDQIENLSKDSIYLMKVLDDTLFTKIQFDANGNIAGYDSAVQRLSYNYINFNNGSANKEALVIMKKKAPMVNTISTLNINVNSSLTIPLSQLFSDPDSIHNDMTFQILNASPTGLNLSINNGNIIINTTSCFSGSTSFSVQAIHDGLTSSNTINVTIPAITPPVVTANSSTTFCQGGSITLTSNITNGNRWYKDGTVISGATAMTLGVNASGNYIAKATLNGCESAASNVIVVTVNPIPSTPTISAGTATTFCTGGSVTLTSSASSGNQWYKDGVAIGSATGSTLNVNASGSYTSKVTVNGCESPASNTIVVTVNLIPPAPVITANTATTICVGENVTLTSNAATGNQWYKDGIAISGSTSTTLNVSASGNYTAKVTISGCESAVSNTIVVTVKLLPSTPTITKNGIQLMSNAVSGNQWYLGANIISGATGQIHIPTAPGNYTVQVTANGCKSAFSSAFNIAGVPDIQVLPNPVRNKLTIIRSDNLAALSIRLLDMNGREIKRMTSAAPITEIDMSGYAAGIYIIWIDERSRNILMKKTIVKL